MAHATASSRSAVIAVALISAAALAYEILLMRLFSIVLWHHFAYMIISLALLGYGASGAVADAWRSARCSSASRRCSAPPPRRSASARSAASLLAQRVPFNPLEFLWDPRQPAYLLAVYLLLLLPFLCAGACVCMALSRFRGMRLAHLQLRHPGRGCGQPRHRGAAVRAVAGRRVEADRRAGVRRRGGGVARMRRPAALAGGRC